ncbi:MAG: amidohydrolase family protein [Myxococcota bacterium]|nr:amidohydrolase family protein [Myxococcota bacterium]
MSQSPPVIDTFVNVNMGSIERPEWLTRVAEDYFDRSQAIFQDISAEQLLETMDENGVDKAIITMRALEPDDRILAFASKHPQRFSLSISCDPRQGMKSVRALRQLASDHRVSLARLVPFMTNVAANEAACYPLFAACCDLDLAISVNTGIPGPPAPGMVQHPMHLDEVCLFFPELKLVMAHGADPWWAEAIRLMLKYKNLYLMTSAYAPKYLPDNLLQFMNSRGRDKIIFASDHPVLGMDRCAAEARALALKPEALSAYLYGNAQRLFFDPLEVR